LKMGTIADLIRFRLETEKTVERVLDQTVQTEFGEFRLVAYRDLLTQQLHYALVKGVVRADQPVLVRVHVKDVLSDVLTVLSPELPTPLRPALAAIQLAGAGVAVVLQNPLSAQAQLAQLHAGVADISEQWRTHGLGAQILADLGARRLRVLGKRRKFSGLSGFGLEVVEQLPLPPHQAE
jgi:3,4-dihydroxy 2-butanone 4-phosphate synthase / GTP cyclohydrolase II